MEDSIACTLESLVSRRRHLVAHYNSEFVAKGGTLRRRESVPCQLRLDSVGVHDVMSMMPTLVIGPGQVTVNMHGASDPPRRQSGCSYRPREHEYEVYANRGASI